MARRSGSVLLILMSAILLSMVPQPIFLSSASANLSQKTSSLSVASSQYLAGYEINGPGGSLNYVASDWYVPSVSCSLGENSISYYQVGFDVGPSNNGLVDEGVATSSGCVGGDSAYSWYFISVGELSQLGNPIVHSGDHMSARIPCLVLVPIISKW